MKKVCILSMQRIQNFGSLLQSYSLKKVLEEIGFEVHFIDIEKNEQDNCLTENKSVRFDKEQEMSNNLLSKFKKIDRYIINRISNKYFANQQDKMFENFRTNELSIKDIDNDQKYDLCVIGSDEVFNCMSPTPWGFTSQLFGNVKQADKVITYAASCGSTKYSDINSEMANIIKNAFNNISAFSSRDENTTNFIKNLTDKPVEQHFDPVWIGDFSEEISKIQISIKLPKNYCIIYSYHNRIYDKKEIQSILNFCKSKKLTPIALGAPQKWIRRFYTVSPFEMIKIFQNADFIVTDTFHGTIFSEKFNGRYAVLFRESNKNKLSDLVNKINAQNHLIDDFENISKVYNAFNDRNDVLELQQKAKQQSVNYLKKYCQ